MADRIASDHESVTTHRAQLARSGGTRRPCLRIPDEVSLDSGDLIRLVIDREEYHARVEEDSRGLVVRGAYDNRRLARTTGEGENRLVEWVDSLDRGPGDSVEFDEIEPGHFYGVRVPGRRVVYDVTEKPDSSLASIAERLEE